MTDLNTAIQTAREFCDKHGYFLTMTYDKGEYAVSLRWWDAKDAMVSYSNPAHVSIDLAETVMDAIGGSTSIAVMNRHGQ